MSDYIHLVGAEAVERAGQNVQAAAEKYDQSVATLDQVLASFLRRFEELVVRLEHAMEAGE